MSDYMVIREIDEIAADIWRDKKEFQMTYTQIASSRNLKSSFVKQKYATAMNIVRHQEQLWLSGLSTRARHAVLQYGFKNKIEMKNIIFSGIVMLEELPSVGIKTRNEIREWLLQD